MMLQSNGGNADSQYLAASLSSLSRSRSAHSHLVRTYKQATQLYLTKRFVDALDTLEPLITPSPSVDETPTSFDSQETLRPGSTTVPPRAPVAQSSRSTRIKVWVFYLSLLHAIIELGPEEGKLAFGSTRWRELESKVRDGTVWEEVVRAGYDGQEGDVDAEVVSNLATLLLGHMATQTVNQQRIESWLAASTGGGGDTDSIASFPADAGTMTPNSQAASSPKALATRLKILELYTLHVLPANGEWAYAREFIEMNDVLDEDRREVFLHALQVLKEELDGTALRERELAARREREMEEQEAARARARAEQVRQEEEERRRKAEEAAQRRKPPPTPPPSAHSKPDSTSSTPKSSSNNPSTHNGHHLKPASRSTSKPTRRPQPTTPAGSSRSSSTDLLQRASAVLRNMHQLLIQASRSMVGNPLSLLRTLMFALAFLMIVARRDLRTKIRRAVEEGWVKVKRTVGMGVKVSYI